MKKLTVLLAVFLLAGLTSAVIVRLDDIQPLYSIDRRYEDNSIQDIAFKVMTNTTSIYTGDCHATMYDEYGQAVSGADYQKMTYQGDGTYTLSPPLSEITERGGTGQAVFNLEAECGDRYFSIEITYLYAPLDGGGDDVNVIKEGLKATPFKPIIEGQDKLSSAINGDKGAGGLGILDLINIFVYIVIQISLYSTLIIGAIASLGAAGMGLLAFLVEGGVIVYAFTRKALNPFDQLTLFVTVNVKIIVFLFDLLIRVFNVVVEALRLIINIMINTVKLIPFVGPVFNFNSV